MESQRTEETALMATATMDPDSDIFTHVRYSVQHTRGGRGLLTYICGPDVASRHLKKILFTDIHVKNKKYSPKCLAFFLYKFEALASIFLDLCLMRSCSNSLRFQRNLQNLIELMPIEFNGN